MKSPKQQVLEMIQKKVENEKDKWNSGMKNNFFAWCDIQDRIFECLKQLRD